MNVDDVEVLEQSLDALEDIFYVFSVEGELLIWNDRATEVTGYRQDDVDGMSPTDFVVADHRRRIADSIQETLETGRSTVEADLLTKDGRELPHQFRGRRLTDDDGKVIGFAGIGRDVTRRKTRERQLEEQAARLELFSIAFPDLAFVVDETGRFNDYIAGGRSASLLYDDPSAFLGETAHDVFPEDLADQLVSTTRTCIETGESQRHEYALELPDRERWFEARIEPLPFDVEGIRATVWVARDVTDRKDQERELVRQNERLKKLASIVSHDLRNPLNVAQGRLEMVATDCESEHVDHIANAHDRMRRIIDDVLWLAREGRDIGTTDLVGLGDAVEASWRIVADGSPRSELVHAARLGTIRADPARLDQLLENLFRNAIEHGGEAVTVTVGPLDDGFYVSDDGPGIPESARDDVFEAGYTTSQDGTGFGLNIVREIVDAHGWQVSLVEGADGGARFELTGVEAAD